MISDAEIMAQVLAAFQEEQAEHRQAAGELLLELERTPDHPQRQSLLEQLFREAHSLKGGARAAGLADVEQIAHRIEDLFSAVREGRVQLSAEVCDPVYAALDLIGALMEQVAQGQTLDLLPHTPLLETLARAAGAAEPRPQPEPQAQPEAEMGEQQVLPGDLSPRGAATVRIGTATLDNLLNEAGELVTCSLRSQQHARDTLDLAEIAGRWQRIWRQTRPVYDRLSERAPVIRPAVHYLEGRPELPGSDQRTLDHQTDLLLSALREANSLLGELERSLSQQGRQIGEDSTQLAAVIERVHDQVRRARMQPLKTIFGQLRLQTREMSRAADKLVRLDLDDGEAEADREILERLRDVLLHLLRNAIDHGIEPPSARSAQAKPPEGRISLRAEVVGDRLVLTMRDDGAGLDLRAIARRAVEGGHLQTEELAHLSEQELSQLIFLPGLSTRQTVSALSGRGVGLDIVRAHIERMRGRVKVESSPGQGCSFTLSLPFSLTRSHGLLIQAGPACYAVPLDAVQRLVSVGAGDIHILEGRAALLADGRPLPLVHLADLLGEEGDAHKSAKRARLALLLGGGERQIACLIDEVLGEQELITHRLPAPIEEARFVAGATILHDGSVVPILDAGDLLTAALGVREVGRLAPEPEEQRRQHHVLIVDDSITTRTLEKNILEAAGYSVRLATDGVEALQVLEQMSENGGCDLLLSDVDMPRMNGFELTAQVRTSPHHQSLPIILVTSLDSPADRERGIAAGADAYIVKRTFDQQSLLETIAHFI
jgi:two-component system chemotaxis sensor kinase CheA